jgi:hypothetical protein
MTISYPIICNVVDYLRNNPGISIVIDQLYSQEGNNNETKWHRPYPEKDEVKFKTIFWIIIFN